MSEPKRRVDDDFIAQTRMTRRALRWSGLWKALASRHRFRARTALEAFSVSHRQNQRMRLGIQTALYCLDGLHSTGATFARDLLKRTLEAIDETP